MSEQNFVENKLYLSSILRFIILKNFIVLRFYHFSCLGKTLDILWQIYPQYSIFLYMCYRFITFESFWKFHSNGFNSVWYMIRQQAIKMSKERPKSVWYFWTCPSNIIKLPDKISIENGLFVGKSLNNQLPKIFNNWFVFSFDKHKCETSCSEKGMLKVKSFNTKSHGKQAVIYCAINTTGWLQGRLSLSSLQGR